MSRKSGKRFTAFLENSAVVRGFNKLVGKIYKMFSSGVYGFVFGNYDAVCETYENSAIGIKQSQKRGRFCRYISRNIEKSVIINRITAFMLYLSRLSMRVIGIFLLSSGFYTFLAQTIIYLVGGNTSAFSFAVAIAMTVLGLPMMLSGKAFCRIVSDSLLLGGIVRDFFGLRKLSLEYDGEPTGKKGIAFILGLPFGVLSFFVEPALLITVTLCVILAYLVMVNAEFGYNAAIFAFPLLIVFPHSGVLLAALVVFAFFSYQVKLIMGKRYFKFDFFDIIVICFVAAMMLGGIVSYGGIPSFKTAVVYVSLILGYFLTVGILNSKAALLRTVRLLCVSMVFVSLISIYQKLSINISSEWIDTEMLDSMADRVVAAFDSYDMLGEYLILLLPLILAASLGSLTWKNRSVYFACFCIGCICLAYTWSKGAWIGFALSIVLLLLMWNKKALGIIAFFALVLSLASWLLPHSIASKLAWILNISDFSVSYRLSVWQGSAALASDYAMSGIGVGTAAFGNVYPEYALVGAENAPHAYNLFLQLFLELGVFGFVVFVALLICMLQTGFSLAKSGADNEVRLTGCGAMAGIAGSLAFGMTDYIWSNFGAFFVFWVVIGIVSAAYRIDRAMRAKTTVMFDDTMAELVL